MSATVHDLVALRLHGSGVTEAASALLVEQMTNSNEAQG